MTTTTTAQPNLSGSSSSTQPTQTIQYQTGLDPNVAPYAQNVLGAAAGQVFTYDANGNVSGMQAPQVYGGSQVAQFTPMQQQAFQGEQNATVNPVTGAAGQSAYDMSMAAANTGYTPMSFSAPSATGGGAAAGQGIASLPTNAPTYNGQQTGYNPSLTNYQMQGPGSFLGTQANGQSTASAYMSPYIQQALDVQENQAAHQAQIQQTQQDASMATAGAYGGTRQAVEDAELQRNLGLTQSNIEATGMQSAYQNAEQQFTTEQQMQQAAGIQNLAANLGVQQLGTQTGLQTSLANLSAAEQQQLANQQLQGQYGLTAAQLGTQVSEANAANTTQAGIANSQEQTQASIANQSAAMQAQQLASQSSQFGAGLGLQGLQAGITGMSTAANMGNLAFNQDQSIIGAQDTMGTQQQQQTQNLLTTDYNTWLNQQNLPYNQLDFMSNLVHGTPTTTTGSQVYTAPPSMASTIGGAALTGIGAAGASGAFGQVGTIPTGKKGGVMRAPRTPPRGLAALAVSQMGA